MKMLINACPAAPFSPYRPTDCLPVCLFVCVFVSRCSGCGEKPLAPKIRLSFESGEGGYVCLPGPRQLNQLD